MMLAHFCQRRKPGEKKLERREKKTAGMPHIVYLFHHHVYLPLKKLCGSTQILKAVWAINTIISISRLPHRIIS